MLPRKTARGSQTWLPDRELNKCRSPAHPGPCRAPLCSPLSTPPVGRASQAQTCPAQPCLLPPGSPRCLLGLGPSRVLKGDGHTINPLSFEGDTPYRVLTGDAPGGARANHLHPRDRPGPGHRADYGSLGTPGAAGSSASRTCDGAVLHLGWHLPPSPSYPSWFPACPLG